MRSDVSWRREPPRRLPMFFRVEYTLHDLGLAPGDSLEFTEESPPTKAVIRRPATGEDARIKHDECLGIIETEEPVTDKVRPKFEIYKPPHPAVEEIGSRITRRLA